MIKHAMGALLGAALWIAPVLAADTPAVVTAEKEEQAMTLPATDFYRTTDGDLHGKPGTLVRAEPFSGYALSGVKATRIIYRSRSQLGHETVASAAVIVPDKAAPKGGWPVLIWAHGTTGVARQCAPTLTRPVGYYTTELVKEGLKRGFAVVAVDYSGLGAGTQHEYLWKEANANDTAFAAPAARAAVKSLAPVWVAIGHSQGGQAVWGVAEKMVSLKDETYRGAVALAPAVDSEPLVNNANGASGETFYPVYVAYGIKAALPDYKIGDLLQPTGTEAYSRLTTQGCWDLAHALFLPVTPGSVVRTDWTHAPDAQLFIKSNQVGEKAVAGPMFIASGDVDTAVPPRIVADRAKALCKLGATVKYKMYPGDHGTMMQSSYEDQMQWIADRFAGKPAATECP